MPSIQVGMNKEIISLAGAAAAAIFPVNLPGRLSLEGQICELPVGDCRQGKMRDERDFLGLVSAKVKTLAYLGRWSIWLGTLGGM